MSPTTVRAALINLHRSLAFGLPVCTVEYWDGDDVKIWSARVESMDTGRKGWISAQERSGDLFGIEIAWDRP